LQYIYSAMWFIVGFILILRMGRENRVFYPLGSFFIILGGWWLANAVYKINLFEGTWGLVLRLITAAVLVVACVAFYKEVKKNGKLFRDSNNKDDNEK